MTTTDSDPKKTKNVSDGSNFEEFIEPVAMSDEELRARRKRSAWIALALFAFVIMIFVITMVRLGGNVVERAL